MLKSLAHSLDLPETKSPVEVKVYPKDAIYAKDDQYYFAIKFFLKDGWKTYWKNPGDAGSPLQIKLENNSSVESLEIKFPFPNEFSEKGVKTIGYEKDVIFPVDIMPRSTKNLKTYLKLDYLICKDICIPITEKKIINLNFDNIINSDEFDDYYSKVPSNRKNIFDIKLNKTRENQLLLEVNSNKAQIDTLKVFAYTKDASVYVNETEKRNNSIFKISFDEDLENIKSPVFFSISDGKFLEEIKIILGDLDHKYNFLYYIFLGLIGGMILNLMPCVLPVLSLKLYSFSKLVDSTHNDIRLKCFLIIAGIIFSFIILAISIIFLKIFGQTVGWGFQFQNSFFLIFITTIILIFSLNLMGFFELILPNSIQYKINKSLNLNNNFSHFLSGTFATLLATPCSAPFLGTAVGFSMVTTNSNILIIFLSIAIGFSFPYILFILFPKILRFLPKPGTWMAKLRFSLGVLLFLAAIWLLDLLKVNYFLIGIFTIITFYICYLKDKDNLRRTVLFCSVIIFLVSNVGKLNFKENKILWQNFENDLLNQYLENGDIILVDVTADWCITCQVNKLTTLNSRKVQKYIDKYNIKTIRADWTKKDSNILNYIKSFDRFGIPVNIVYGPKYTNGILLPEILTKDMLIRELKKVSVNED